ncbi:ribbon-helix-helix protein, CopG family [Burkholderia sp. 9779_493]|nr:ribbon-helix-helix protein, CopG family [Burkholderia sp. 9779_493]
MLESTGMQSRMKCAQSGEARVISFKVQPEMRRAIRLRAVDNDVDVSEVIRRALTHYLEHGQDVPH